MGIPGKELNVINIDEISMLQSKARVKENRPFASKYIALLFVLVIALLVLCMIYASCFNIEQITFLGIAGSTVISFSVLFLTLQHEKRGDYIRAKKSAMMLSGILDSVYQQIERIKNGPPQILTYPDQWINYYENCCTYLEYNYLPYLLREFDILEKINQCIIANDKDGINKLLAFRNNSITDWTLDFDIISTKRNLSLFASGSDEECPWKLTKSYIQFEKFVIENCSDKIKQLTIDYLKAKNGHCDSHDAEYYVMEKLKKDPKIQSSPYKWQAFENRKMLNVIFKVYLSLQASDGFSLCWGELSLVEEAAVPSG